MNKQKHTNKNVYLVWGEDSQVYGAYLRREDAYRRKTYLSEKHGNYFYVTYYPLGDQNG